MGARVRFADVADIEGRQCLLSVLEGSVERRGGFALALEGPLPFRVLAFLLALAIGVLVIGRALRLVVVTFVFALALLIRPLLSAPATRQDVADEGAEDEEQRIDSGVADRHAVTRSPT
jgi:hypothetical protein